ncbi:MAG TPA: O-antigen ligase family protein [Solirubrobacteraceae bacterium]|nr:O-antigen ligase family protein [Solirubrobacteraceae bacterium]
MEASSTARVRIHLSAGRLPSIGSAVAGSALSFAAVGYLALSDGGYDTIPRSQLGIVAWWAVVLAAVAGVRPRRLGRTGWVALGLMVSFTVWTGATITWSLSPELSADQLGMVATYAGVFALALTVQGRTAARHAVYGAATAVGLIAVIAVLSRLHGSWFPPDPRLAYQQSASRLAYPLGYWNGLAAFLAMGVPLLLSITGGARRVACQALAAAALPVAALGIFLADSRGGVIAVAIGLVVFILLTGDRLCGLASVAAAALGSGVLIAYADHHSIVRQGVDTIAARRADDRMVVVLVLACAGVAMLQVAIGLAGRHAARPVWLEPRPRQQALRIAAVLGAVLAVGLASGVPSRLDRAWQDFKKPMGAATQTVAGSDVFSRLSSAGGNDRYQLWQQAVKADASHPLTGIGAGTFGLWWQSHASVALHVSDAHSLYLQTLAETGIVGLILIGGVILCLLAAGIRRTLRAPPSLRLPLAGATAGIAVFGVSAAYDWVWQLGAIACLALILGAVCLVGGDPESTRFDAGPAQTTTRRRRLAGRAASGGVVVVALVAVVAIALPLAVARDLAASQSAAGRGALGTALADAKAAERVQPLSASAALQEALVLEQAGDLGEARSAAVTAVDRDAANWQPRLVLARIEDELGWRGPALASFERARRLNPLGAVFNP